MNICKIMLLGAMGVGKTSIARRLVFNEFGGEYRSTIGVEVLTYDIPKGPGDIPFKFMIWDTDGSFGEAIMESVYMKGAHAALLVGDVSRTTTLSSLQPLAEQFEAALPGRYSAVVLNKVDLLDPNDSEIALPERLITPMRKSLHTSAKTGEGIVDLFQEAAETVIRRGLLS